MPPAPLAISATAHDRPHRLQRLLDSVARAEGASRWPVYLSVEPTDRTGDIEAVIEGFSKQLSIRHRVNASRLGVRRNPFETVQWVLEQGHDTVLLLEDDLLIDAQALRWCELLAAGPLKAAGVLAANLLMTTCMSESVFVPPADHAPGMADLVLRTRFFSSYGLLFTRAQWDRHFVPNWFKDEPVMENFEGGTAAGWDVAMNRALLTDPGLCVLQSLLPRVTHDGADGTHVTQAFQDAGFAHVQVDAVPQTRLQALRVIDPVADLGLVPDTTTRMYINLARHFWTLQSTSLRFKHRVPDFHGARARWWRVGSYEYVLHRKRAPR